MKHRFRLCGIILGLFLIPGMTHSRAQAEIQEGAVEAALIESQKQGKHLLIAFLGTGWSMSSDRMHKRVLETPIFKDYAEKNLIFLKLEARRKPPLSKEESKLFQEWVARFDILTYPTLILLAPDGQEVFRHGYKELEPDAYVQLLRTVIP